MKRCLGCMEEYHDELVMCPHCGHKEGTVQENALHMTPGSILADRYIVGKVIGYGGFGVTYIGWDCLLETKVAIKEYLPSEFSTRVMGQTEVTVFTGDKQEQFADGLSKFTEEAKKLAKYHSLTGIVKIFDSIEANNTAYIIMELLEGETLADILKRNERFTEDETMQMMIPIIESLDQVHEDGIIHRDIAPDNIFVTTNGEVKLIDFGAARYATTTHSRSLTVIIKPGYSPEEQYRSRGDQGPHTDVYAVAATMYKMLTGVTPPDALERRALFENKKKDILEPISRHAKEVGESRRNAILNALNVRIEDRTPNMKEFMDELTSVDPVKRRAGKIRRIDLYKWPVWAKISFPTIAAALMAFTFLFVTGIIGFEVVEKSDITIPDGQTRVPSVVSSSYISGKYKLMESKLIAEISDRVPSDKLDKDLIMFQSINGGAVVQENSVVNVVVSGGEQTQPVPDVRGLSREDAEQKLRNLGFAVLFEEAYDDTIAEGYVVRQSLDPDTEAKEGSEITLTISKGRDPNKAIEEKDVTLPNLIGMKYDDALKEAQKLGVSIKITEKRYSMSFEKDTVMKQSPEPGSTVKNTVTVEIIISLGYSKIIVPDVSLISEEKAVALLEGRGLRCKVKYEKNNNIAAGHVISQDPFKETEVDPETLVTITVSMGAESFEMPDVVGLTREEAKALLESKGLSVSVNYEQNDDSPEGTVLTQSIKKGSGVIRGDTVILTICSHSETITVPYLVGMTQSEAEKEIRNAGLKVNVITVHGSDGDKGKVAAQSPTAGSGLRKGDTVSISVSDGGSDDTDSTADVGNDSSGKTDSSGSSESGSNTESSSNTESGGNSGGNNGSGEKLDDPNPITVELNTNELTLDIDETSVLSYETDTSKWIVTSEEWTSSKNNIVTVDGKGKVTAVDSGTAKIILTLRGKNSSGEKVTITAECEVTVKPPVQASEIILSETSLEMVIGDTAKLKATVKPDNAKNKRVSWSSSISSVVTVEDGYVKAVGVGTASVIATTSNGKTASCKITVKAPVPTGVTLSRTSVTLNEGESETITATVVPSNVIAKSVTWTSGNRSVATVSDGKITAVGKGTTTITATTSNGLKATCTVTVNEILPTSVSLDQTELTLYENEMTVLTETVLPTKAKSKSVTWKSSDPNVASVSDGKIAAIKAGKATITAETVNGLKASCAVTVLPIIRKLNYDSAVLNVGETLALDYTIDPKEPLYSYVATWSSSDTSIAEVDKNGVVTAIKPGNATISAKIVRHSTGGGDATKLVTLTCKITVQESPYPTEIRINLENVLVYVGNTQYVVAIISPEYVKNKDITWSSDDTDVATVSKDGKITGVGVGMTTVTAKTKNGLTASCTVKVEKEEVLVAQGKCGENVYWSLNTDGVFTISGEGAMYDHSRYGNSSSDSPWYKYGTDVKKVIVEEGVTHIEDYTFWGFKNMEEISIPDTVETIEKAFTGPNYSLKSLYIPASVREFSSENGLGSLYGLVELEVDKDNPYYVCVDGIIYNKSKTEVVKGAPYITKADLPFGVEIIDSRAFEDCSKLKTVYLPSSLKKINRCAFMFCGKIDSIKIPDSVTYLGDYAFSDCRSLTTLVIPDSITEINRSTFQMCEGLTSVTIPSSVEYIYDHAFSGSTSLTEILIPETVKSIDEKAFGFTYSGKRLESFTIKCYSDTAAEQYAIENKINYVLLD